jgi:GTPase SAR1 family protein
LKFIFITGTAGSGKSTLILSLEERLRASEVDVATLNLDPGVLWLPYTPDVDIRDYINYERMIEDYKLGPNGALVACVDAAVNHVKEMKEELQKLSPDYVLVDTPGQMELFAYRDSGMFIASTISDNNFSVLFLADSIFLNRASDYVAILLLSYSINARFKAPQINCISKVDLLPKELYDRGLSWISEPYLLKDAFLEESHDIKTEMSERMLDLLIDIGALGEFIFTSSNTGEGLDDLYAQIQRVHTGGEDR